VSKNGSRVFERNRILLRCGTTFHPLLHYVFVAIPENRADKGYCTLSTIAFLFVHINFKKGILVMISNSFKVKKLTVAQLCKISMLVAITFILSYISGYLRIGPISKFNISFISVYVAGAAFGPIIAGLVAALADVVSFLANSTGPFVPWFTIIEFVNGMLFGLIFYRRDDLKINIKGLVLRAILCVLLQYLVNILRTYILAFLYFDGKFLVTFVSRIPSTSIMAVFKAVVIIAVEPFMKTILKAVRD